MPTLLRTFLPKVFGNVLPEVGLLTFPMVSAFPPPRWAEKVAVNESIMILVTGSGSQLREQFRIYTEFPINSEHTGRGPETLSGANVRDRLIGRGLYVLRLRCFLSVSVCGNSCPYQH